MIDCRLAVSLRFLPALALGLLCLFSGPLPHAAKTLVYCSEGSPEGFDPARYTSGTTFTAVSQTIFSRLVEFEPGGTRVVPDLALRWEVGDEGRTYVFHLRPGVKFQTTEWFTPSRELNADDVIFTFDRMINRDNPFQKAAPVSFPYAADMELAKDIASIEKIDALTLKISLKKVNAAFLADLAMDFSSIQSAEYAQQLLAAGRVGDFNTRPVGTGPFILRRYDKDAQIRFVGFDGYWRGRPKIENLIFAIVTDSAVRVQKLKANECQVSAYPKPQEVETLRSDPNIKLLSQQGLNVGYLSINVRHKPLDNLEVRRAINMAIDKKTLIAAVYQGAGVVAINPIPPTMWSYNRDIKDYPYDPAAARALLAKAGFPDGFEISLWALPVQRPYNPNGQKSAELIQADLAKIGIRAHIVKYEWGEYLKRANAGESDLGLFGWTGDNGDPDNFLASLLSCASIGSSNPGQWCNKEFDSTIAAAKETTNVAERTRLYEQAQRIFKDDAPWVTLAHSIVFLPMRKNVEGFVMSPLGTVKFFAVDLR